MESGIQDTTLDFGPIFRRLRRTWWKIALLSLFAGTVTFAIMRTFPNQYLATAVVSPPPEDTRQSPALGALASIGLTVGGPSSVEDLEALFRSRDLAAQVFRKHDLWPVVLGDRYDNVTKNVKVSRLSRMIDPEAASGPPGDWDAIRAVKDKLGVNVNKKAGTVSVSFESPSAQGSADVVRFYLEEGKRRLQEDALVRAGKNKRFILDQIAATFDPITRERLYSIYGQEVEREMLARNQEQFGFKVIDSVRVPDKKSGPKRVKTAALAMALSVPFGAFLFGALEKRRVARNPAEGKAAS
ncbi:MAG TPA: Wzz/FepE/Etk N-terminal domain-containing protein [Candidatus Deferrimicrobiaceae bacterium]